MRKRPVFAQSEDGQRNIILSGPTVRRATRAYIAVASG